MPESVVHVTVKCQGMNKKTDWRSELLSDRRRRERKPYLQVNVGLSLHCLFTNLGLTFNTQVVLVVLNGRVEFFSARLLINCV